MEVITRQIVAARTIARGGVGKTTRDTIRPLQGHRFPTVRLQGQGHLGTALASPGATSDIDAFEKPTWNLLGCRVCSGCVAVAGGSGTGGKPCGDFRGGPADGANADAYWLWEEPVSHESVDGTGGQAAAFFDLPTVQQGVVIVSNIAFHTCMMPGGFRGCDLCFSVDS